MFHIISNKLLHKMLDAFKVSLFLLITVSVLPSTEAKICYEIDARNDPTEIELALRNCTIVVGSVRILLIEKHGVFDFNSLRFPELQEITGYLLLFRVFGVKTLRYMFPNLKVIRGERLIGHYSLIIYDMSTITEIVLSSLIKIQQGYVMVSLCPMLCYSDTIDWNRLTEKSHTISGANGITQKIGNHVPSEIPALCPTKKSCPISCENCWSYQHCQLSDTGYSWVNKTMKCHEECIGGCVNETSSGCSVCRNYRLLNYACVRECPANLYVLSTLCVDANYCRSQRMVPFDHECLHTCPKNYKQNNDTSALAPQCIKCDPKCLRECPSAEVDSLGRSEELRGCQVIVGDLYIRLHHPTADTTERLERNLGDIEEIIGVLRVYRSPALTTLSFLRNLRIIHGNQTIVGKYTIMIMENEHLQRLWDFNEKKDLELGRGNMLVHFNSKLCLSEIYALQKMLKTNTSLDWIGRESNGNQETCSARVIQTFFDVLTTDTVKITIERIDVPIYEKIVRYIIYYMVAPERKLTHFGIDNCAQFGWESHFIQNISTDANVTYYTANLTNLIQNTQYAFYVKIQVAPKVNESNALNISQGQSEIKYFKTKYAIPTYPKVETFSKTSDTITLNWFPIASEPEKVDYYKVDIYRQPDEHSVLDERNYCDEPRVDVHVSHGVETAPDTTTLGCAADFEQWRESHYDSEDLEHEWRLHRKSICSGENSMNNIDHRTEMTKFLGNVKSCGDDPHACWSIENIDSLRFKRQIHYFVNRNNSKSSEIKTPPSDKNLVDNLIFSNAQFNATIKHLRPFTTYIFLFFSCNDISCSTYDFHFERTNSAREADVISKIIVSNDPYDSHRIYVDFDEPETPNGLTVAFNIEKFDWTSFNTTVECITRKQHFDNGKRFIYSHLPKGHYSFRVQSISLAANGPYTDHINISIVVKESQIRKVGIYFVYSLIVLSLGAIVSFFYRLFRKKYRIVNVSSSRENMLLQMDDTSYTNRPVNEHDVSFNHTHKDRESF